MEIADKYLEVQANAYKDGENSNLQQIKNKFNQFNMFIIKLSEFIEYPFSSAIFKGEDKRSVKFHTGVSMVLATIFYYFDIDMNSPFLLEEVQDIILNSPLGDETYNASSTNMRNVMNYLYIKNKVFDKEYKSMRYKGNISSDIIQVLNKNE